MDITSSNFKEFLKEFEQLLPNVHIKFILNNLFYLNIFLMINFN